MDLYLTPAVQAKTAILRTTILDLIRMHGLYSEGPELPLADEEEHPPALDEESESENLRDADTVDYESAREEDEEDWYADVRSFHTECRRWRPRKPQTDE